MTEYESHAASKVIRSFRRDLGRIVANALAQMPQALEGEMLEAIQGEMRAGDSPYQDPLTVMRTNYGTTAKAEVPDFLSL